MWDITALIAVIAEIFGVINRRDIFLVFDVPGEVWMRSSAEATPFVKEFVLQHCYQRDNRPAGRIGSAHIWDITRSRVSG